MRGMAFLLGVLTLACSGGASGSDQDRHALAVDRVETSAAPARIRVSSPAFPAGAAIPLRHSAYGDGASPPLAWANLPEATVSLALMMEDPDASSARPYVHWLAWNIDPGAGSLPESVAPDAAGLAQGRNNRRGNGYFGPRPSGSRPHRYHFQLFALDTRLDLAAGADREALLAAMNGHVLAKGDLVGLFGRPSG